jgi:hypothetical protein
MDTESLEKTGRQLNCRPNHLTSPTHHQNQIRRVELFPELPNQLIVIGVGTDPIPDDVVSVTDTDGAVIQPNPHRKNGAGWVNRLETQTWVMRIVNKKTICLPRLFLNVGRQFCKGFPKLVCGVGVHRVSGSSFLVLFALCSANASSARLDSASLDFANSFDQRCSECNSSKTHVTNCFCSAGGSF